MKNQLGKRKGEQHFHDNTHSTILESVSNNLGAKERLTMATTNVQPQVSKSISLAIATLGKDLLNLRMVDLIGASI
jgi:hypothetical protein